VLFRHEKIPLVRHVGEWLTVSVLAARLRPADHARQRTRARRVAALPAHARGAWRILASTVAARYVIILSAGALQFAARPPLA